MSLVVSLWLMNGNPKVVHVDQEFDYKITELADDFETFIEMLQNEDDFE